MVKTWWQLGAWWLEFLKKGLPFPKPPSKPNNHQIYWPCKRWSTKPHLLSFSTLMAPTIHGSGKLPSLTSSVSRCPKMTWLCFLLQPPFFRWFKTSQKLHQTSNGGKPVWSKRIFEERTVKINLCFVKDAGKSWFLLAYFQQNLSILMRSRPTCFLA